MKKYLHLIILVAVIALLCISGIAGTLYHTGSPGAKTGSPKDGANCTQCHTGSTVSEVNWITTTIPESGWLPNQTYTIVATAVHANAQKMGFELTAENSTSKTGTFIITDNVRTKLANNNTSVTHTTNGNTPSNGENSWEFNWTSPESGQEDITFYAAFNCANGDGTNSGDQIFISSLTIPKDETATGINESNASAFTVYPNPVKDQLTINSPNRINKVEVISNSGKRVKLVSNVNTNKIQIDLINLNRGIYMIKASTSEGEKIQLITKE